MYLHWASPPGMKTRWEVGEKSPSGRKQAPAMCLLQDLVSPILELRATSLPRGRDFGLNNRDRGKAQGPRGCQPHLRVSYHKGAPPQDSKPFTKHKLCDSLRAGHSCFSGHLGKSTLSIHLWLLGILIPSTPRHVSVCTCRFSSGEADPQAVWL